MHSIAAWQSRIQKLHNQSIKKFLSGISKRCQVSGRWTGGNPFSTFTCYLWYMFPNTCNIYYTTSRSLNKIIRNYYGHIYKTQYWSVFRCATRNFSERGKFLETRALRSTFHLQYRNKKSHGETFRSFLLLDIPRVTF